MPQYSAYGINTSCKCLFITEFHLIVQRLVIFSIYLGLVYQSIGNLRLIIIVLTSSALAEDGTC